MENITQETPAQEFPASPTKTWRSRVIPVLLFILVILLVAVGYLFYQNQSLKKELSKFLPTPTPTTQESSVPSNDSTSNWKTYINKQYNYSFQYPKTYIINEIGSNSSTNLSVVNTCIANESNICNDPESIGFVVKSQNFKPQLDDEYTYIKIDNIKSIKSFSQYWGGDWINVYIPKDKSYISVGTDKINEKVFDQILSKFKFLDDDQQTACTMEAKLCPDGSSVGRSGPNCEFSPCP